VETVAPLERLAEAAAEVVNCIRVLEKSGSNLVTEVLEGGEFIEYEHYPRDDVYDPETHAQYYFHAHPQTRGDWNDYGHFHTFLRPKGRPQQIRPGASPRTPGADATGEPVFHLIAISMNRQGRPVRLFTTNRWVTAETWYAAPDIIAMLDRFVVDLAKLSWPLSRWISAMITLYRADIERLILGRDARIAHWRDAHPDRNVFEDRALEVTSAMAIDLDARLALIRSRLGL
jgi:hypothetical protein